MVDSYKRLSIYTTSSCNLNCNYCYEKNLRKNLIINHPQDYSVYIEKLLENPNNRNSIQQIELWGGEPLKGMQEFISYIPNFFNNFPNWNYLQFSTNFAGIDDTQIIRELYNTIDQWAPNQFTINMQISIDGPKIINDYNRGNGTTDKIIQNINNFQIIQSNKVQLKIVTNSILDKNTLWLFYDSSDIDSWFNFFLNNFPENIKFGLFRPAQLDNWDKYDGMYYAWLLRMADMYREEHPIEAQRFIWPNQKLKSLQLCAVTLPNEQIALSPQGEQCLCHRAILEGLTNKAIPYFPQINLTDVFDMLMDSYYQYQDQISIEDYRESLYIYISNIWCPYQSRYNLYYMNAQLPLYYNGAMNTLLKWSRQYGSS